MYCTLYILHVHAIHFYFCLYYSLYDLHYTVLRQGLTPPKLDNKGVLLLRPPHMLQYDRWAEFMLTTPDPRVIYVISNGTMSSPTPRVTTPTDDY